MKRLSRGQILAALTALAERLGPERCELVVVGGAALVLLYAARETTRDIDAVLPGAEAGRRVRTAARAIAEEQALPDDWLNDAAKGYVHGFAAGDVVLDLPTLRVIAPAPQQLLAMKLCAWRDDLDIDDARLLLSKLQGSLDDVWSTVAPHLVPGREQKARYAFEELWEVERGPA